MHAFVTGSTGFIGTRLVEGVAHLGHDGAAAADVVFHLADRPGVRGNEDDIETLRHPNIVVDTGESVGTVRAVGRHVPKKVVLAADEEVVDTSADATLARALGLDLPTDLADILRQHAHQYGDRTTASLRA